MSGDHPVEPFHIDPATLYPLAWLRERLVGVVELGTLLDRTGLRQKRKFRDALLGAELLLALERLGAYNEETRAAGPAKVVAVRQGGRGRGEAKGAGEDALGRLHSGPVRL